MRFRNIFLSVSAIAVATVVGCAVDVEDPSSQPGDSAEPTRRIKIGKADLWGSCLTKGPEQNFCGQKPPVGNCYCDKACVTYDDCCADYAEACEGGQSQKCKDVGGTCENSPTDPTFPMICEDYGMTTSDALCPAFNQACCVPPTCSPVMCELYCAYGFEKDENGCEICSCNESPPFCGGFANIPCPNIGLFCVDDPTDDCDPLNGGADCGGICVPPNPCIISGGQCVAGMVSSCGEGYEPGPQSCGNMNIEMTCCRPKPPEPSCEGNCGNAAPGKVCYCDAVCEQYGDCCSDYQTFCSDDRTIASGMCVKNSLEACTTDADCTAGGCGGELCYNPSMGGGISTCECTTPTNVAGCGCVNGQCAWYN